MLLLLGGSVCSEHVVIHLGKHRSGDKACFIRRSGHVPRAKTRAFTGAVDNSNVSLLLHHTTESNKVSLEATRQLAELPDHQHTLAPLESPSNIIEACFPAIGNMQLQQSTICSGAKTGSRATFSPPHRCSSTTVTRALPVAEATQLATHVEPRECLDERYGTQ